MRFECEYENVQFATLSQTHQAKNREKYFCNSNIYETLCQFIASRYKLASRTIPDYSSTLFAVAYDRNIQDKEQP